jgi:23S rRNA pseudouridine1911/1915/1917 synthase
LKDEAKNKSKAFVNQVKNSLPSILEYKIVCASEKYFLLEVNPHTGRHHQIRAQLSAMGSPIKGDLKYGAERNNQDASIHLHARAVTFLHPVKKESLTITAPPPNENLWNAFLKLQNEQP